MIYILYLFIRTYMFHINYKLRNYRYLFHVLFIHASSVPFVKCPFNERCLIPARDLLYKNNKVTYLTLCFPESASWCPQQLTRLTLNCST